MKFTTALFGLAVTSLQFASGAGLIVNFDSYASDLDLAGQDGWTITGASSDSGASWVNGSPFPAPPSSGGNAAQLGFEEIDDTTARVSHGLSQMVNGATFSISTLIQDSSNLYPERDQFGLSLGSGGQELFGIYFTPTSQTSSPNGTAPPRVDNISWSSFASGSSGTIGTLNEGNWTTLEVNFTRLSADSLQFTLSSAGVEVLTDTLNSVGIGDPTIDEFSAVWNLFDTVDGVEGGNSIYFDDLSIVPEPSTALLGLLGGLFAFRRRRA